MLNSEFKVPKSNSKNPGVSLLHRALGAGNLTAELVRVAGVYALDHSDYMTKLEPCRQKLLQHLKTSTIEQVQRTQNKEHVSAAITRIREAALIAACGYPDNDPIWDAYHLNVPLTNKEFHALAIELDKKLNRSTEEERLNGMQYLAAAGFMVSEIMYNISPALEQTFKEAMPRHIAAVRMNIAVDAVEDSFRDLKEAIALSKMLESRGITFDKQGDPVYSEQYYELEKKAQTYAANNKPNTGTTGDTPDSANSGGESPEGTI